MAQVMIVIASVQRFVHILTRPLCISTEDHPRPRWEATTFHGYVSWAQTSVLLWGFVKVHWGVVVSFFTVVYIEKFQMIMFEKARFNIRILRIFFLYKIKE